MPKTLQGYREIEFRHWTTTGPRHIEAGLTIHFTPKKELEIKWDTEWPEEDNYSEIIERTIKEEIMERVSGSFGGEFAIKGIVFHKVGSSAKAFEIVVREMMRSFFSLGKLIDY